MADQMKVVLAATRFGWGLSDRDTLHQDGKSWLEKQVGSGLDEGWQLTQSVEDVFQQQQDLRMQRKSARPADQKQTQGKKPADAALQAELLRLAYAQATAAPFLDRLSHFWANHFAISARGGILKGLASGYELQAIRPHVLGSFTDMLMAAVKHPAMLFYLDNIKSIGPNSKAGKRRGAGLNENLAREILELHTLGVDGGYTQEDVTNFAKCLTGWTIDMQARHGALGSFYFNPNWHEPGNHRVLDRARSGDGLKQAESVLREIATRPATARHIARRLARHFTSDSPPKSLVSKLEKRFLDTAGDLREVTLALVQADESWSEKRTRFIPPLAYALAVARALPGSLAPMRLVWAARQMGQPLWVPNSPEGYPDDNASWLNADALKLRLNLADEAARKADIGNNVSAFAERLFGSTLSSQTSKAIARAESARQGLTLLLMSPEFQRR